MDIPGRIKNKILSIIKNQFHFRILLYYTLNLEGDYHIVDMPKGVKVCAGTNEDIDKIAKRYPEIFRGKKKLRFKQRLETGQRLFLVKLYDEIAAYVWHNFNEITLVGKNTIPLEQEEVFLVDGHTFPEFRRKGLFNVFMSESIKLLKKEGYSVVYSSHLSNNIISKTVHKKIGFKNTKKYIMLSIFDKNIIKIINVK